MSLGSLLLFFLSTLACLTLPAAGLYYFLHTRQEALNRRLRELQEHSLSGGAHSFRGGDLWNIILRSTYGTIF